MSSNLTYGQLHDKLKHLNYDCRKVEVDGKEICVFEHNTIDNAMITLPVRPFGDLVEDFHKNRVRSTLRVHRLVVEPDLLDLIPDESNNSRNSQQGQSSTQRKSTTAN